jgi:hypothetical protein
MAFVSRSERKIELNQGEINELGPGQYISPEYVTPIEPAKVPFNTYTYRTTEILKKDVPGPGSYHYDDRYEKIAKMLNYNRGREKVEPLYKYLENNFNKLGPYSLLLDTDGKKAAFGSKEKRFKIDKTVTEVPGPGFYSKNVNLNGSPKPRSKSTEKEKENYVRAQKSSPVKKTGSPRRVVTIPAKMQAFGYEMNEKGELVMNQDPDKNIRYQGVKHDTVGPGSYNVVKSRDWVKNSMDWSRSKNQTVSKSNISTLAHSTDLQDNLLDLNTISSNVKKSVDSIKLKHGRERIFKQITENRKKLLNFQNNVNEPDALVEKFLFSEMPGPGYYFKEDYSKAMQRKPEKFQIFGSSSPRFQGPSLAEMEANEIGPGYYNKDNSKYDRMKMDQIKKSVALKYISKNSGSAEKNRIEKEEMMNKLGPGRYEPKLLPKKAVTTVGNFGSLQKRFKNDDSEKEELPGPGSYVNFDKWGSNTEKESKNEIVRKYFTRRQEKSKEPIEIDKFEVPAVGTYEPDKLFTMAHGVSQKSNAYQSVIAPFSSMQKRFDNNSNKSSENIGPGMYYKEKKPAPVQVFPPFKSGAEKSNHSSQQSPSKPGPGDYNQNSYFDWNKKSFNILYI